MERVILISFWISRYQGVIQSFVTCLTFTLNSFLKLWFLFGDNTGISVKASFWEKSSRNVNQTYYAIWVWRVEDILGFSGCPQSVLLRYDFESFKGNRENVIHFFRRKSSNYHHETFQVITWDAYLYFNMISACPQADSWRYDFCCNGDICSDVSLIFEKSHPSFFMKLSEYLYHECMYEWGCFQLVLKPILEDMIFWRLERPFF